MLVRAKLSIQEIQKFGKPHIQLVKLPAKLVKLPIKLINIPHKAHKYPGHYKGHYKTQKLLQAFCCKYRKSVIIFLAENDSILTGFRVV
jgi:hypothetical protein